MKKSMHTEKELNDKFLNGEIIDYEKMDYSGVNSCHCELPLVFKKQKDWKFIFKDGKDALNDNDIYESLLDKLESDIRGN